jgi:PAS domain S-box-containing protein
MKLYLKIAAACLLSILTGTAIAGCVSFYYSKKALSERAIQYLDIRLIEGLGILKKHERILRQYGLSDIPASIAKARLDALAELSELTVGEQGFVFVVDHTGVIVAHPDKYFTGTDAGSSQWFAKLGSPDLDRLTIRDTPFLIRQQQFTPWNWFVIAAEPLQKVFAPMYRQALMLTLAALLCAAVFIPVTCLFIRWLLTPLSGLSDSIRRLGRDDPDVRIPFSQDSDFSDLIHNFNQTANHVTGRMNRLQKKHAFFHSLFENATDLITITDQEGRLTYITPSAERILGYPPQELIGRNIDDLIHPSEKNLFKTHIRRATDSDKHTLSAEFRMRHSNGTWYVFESVSRNLLSHPDVNGVVTTSRNINRHRSVKENLTAEYKALKIKQQETTAALEQLETAIEKERSDRDSARGESDNYRRTALVWLVEISRNIRYQLSTISGFSRLLPKMLPDKTVRMCLSVIDRSAARVDQQLNNMTALLRINTHTLEPSPECIDFRQLMDNICQPYEHALVEKPILFTHKPDFTIPHCLILDRILLRLILSNLLDKAVSLAPPGRIELSTKKTGESADKEHVDLCIDIDITADTGSLISKHRDPFTQDALLNLCRNLISSMGGRFDLRESGDHRRLIFHLNLPGIGVCRDTVYPGSPADTLDISAQPLKGITAVIAGESGDHGAMLSCVLEFAGCATHTCSGGGQIIRMVREKAPNIILMDPSLLDSGGINTLTLLRQQTCGSTVPVILLELPDMQPSTLNGDEFCTGLALPVDLKLLYHKILQWADLNREQPELPTAMTVLLPAGPIVERARENPEFKEKLKDRIIQKIPEFTAGINMARTNRFIRDLTALGTDYDLPGMEALGQTLSGYAEEFDVEQLSACLNQLPRIFGRLNID